MGDACGVACGPEAPCASGSYCDNGTCRPKLVQGHPCNDGVQCTSGFCADGFCCDGACDGACESCKLGGVVGTCTAVPAGVDPDDECPTDPVLMCARDGACSGQRACRRYAAGTECAAATCSGDAEHSARTCSAEGLCQPATSSACPGTKCAGAVCAAGCGGHADCQSGFFCDQGTCRAAHDNGATCTEGAECATGHCIDGYCCNSACGGTCHACNIAGALGTCTAIPSGEDPGGECPAEAASTCGRAGGCDGVGACRLHAPGTSCAAQTCSGSTETAARTCDGNGTCGEGTTSSCGAYTCGDTSCRTSCTTGATCSEGNVCGTGSCRSSLGLALYWKLDDASDATSAAASSGNALNGTYTGTTGTPTTTTAVPTLLFSDPASRTFAGGTTRQSVRVTMPAALKPTNNITLSAWYRATSTGTNASEVASGGNQYLIRVHPTKLEVSKRTTNAAGTGGTYKAATCNYSGHLDGNWHHLAGVIASDGMRLYYDGVQICSSTDTGNLRYDQGADFWVGRHGNNGTAYDFKGEIDDVRVYTRALSAADVLWLSQGRPDEP